MIWACGMPYTFTLLNQTPKNVNVVIDVVAAALRPNFVI